ncbi:MAG TPA: dihydrofolate reductase [Patescibacteria group bacterium]
MKISAIAIISKNRGLGFENHLLFHVPGELPRFKKITSGHPVIMGRKTHESIGRLLPNRTNIIVSKNPNYAVNGAVMVDSLEEAIKIGKEVEERRLQVEKQSHSFVILNDSEGSHSRDKDSSAMPQNDKKGEIFILGGGQIFSEALPIVDRLYLTVVDATVPADTFFPDYSEFKKVIEKEEKRDWDYPYTFLILEK